jgi:hypothetical protein
MATSARAISRSVVQRKRRSDGRVGSIDRSNPDTRGAALRLPPPLASGRPARRRDDDDAGDDDDDDDDDDDGSSPMRVVVGGGFVDGDATGRSRRAVRCARFISSGRTKKVHRSVERGRDQVLKPRGG